MNFKGSSNTNEWREEEVKAGQGCQERSEGYVSQVDSFQRVSDLWAGAGCLVKPLKHHIKCWNWYLTAKIAKRGRVTQMLARKSLFWGKANAWYYFKPGMSRIPFIKLERKLIGGLLTWLLVTAVICWDFKTIFLSYSLLVLLQLWSSADFTQPSHDAEGAIGMYSASTLLLPMLLLVRLLPVIKWCFWQSFDVNNIR